MQKPHAPYEVQHGIQNAQENDQISGHAQALTARSPWVWLAAVAFGAMNAVRQGGQEERWKGALDFLHRRPSKRTTAFWCKCITIIGSPTRTPRQVSSGAARLSQLAAAGRSRGGDATGFAVARLAQTEHINRLEKCC